MLETIWQFYLQDIVNKTLEMIQSHTFSYLSVKSHLEHLHVIIFSTTEIIPETGSLK